MGSLTARYIFDDLVPKFIAEHPEYPKKVNAVLVFNLEGPGGGSWTVDLKDDPGVYQGIADNAKCTMIISSLDFHALLAGGTIGDWLAAFKQKRIDFTGHLPTFLKLERLFVSMRQDPVIIEYSNRILSLQEDAG